MSAFYRLILFAIEDFKTTDTVIGNFVKARGIRENEVEGVMRVLGV